MAGLHRPAVRCLREGLSRSGGKEQADLESIGEEIRNAIQPSNGASVGWSFLRFLGSLVSAGLMLDPAAAGVRAAFQVFLSTVDLINQLQGETNGPPVGDRVKSRVEELALQVATRLVGTADSLDRIHQVIASDYGRLKELGSVANSPEWSVDIPDVTSKLTLGAKAFFSTQLLPIPWGVYALEPGPSSLNPDLTPDGCSLSGYGQIFKGAPATAQLSWMGDFPRDKYDAGIPTQFVLGTHDLHYHTAAYPPAALTNAIFRTVDRNGYGVQLARFVWIAKC
jgi:hypothetical protein